MGKLFSGYMNNAWIGICRYYRNKNYIGNTTGVNVNIPG